MFLVAGEPSGDALGAGLMAGLRDLAPGVAFAGVGGVEMEAQGLRSVFDMTELSIMGIAEVLPRYRHLVRRLHQTAEAALVAAPDVLVTIDSPDFTLRLAGEVRRRGRVRTVHYVAPSVWAWRKGRAARMARVVDQVLALLPFEPPYMEAAGIRCDFVGHPVATAPQASAADVADWRRATAIGDAPVLLVLPGSRASEVARLLPLFGRAVANVLKRHPAFKVVVPAAEPVAEAVQHAVKDWPRTPHVIDPRRTTGTAAAKLAAFAAADLALAASGTVSLELAASDTPMVIGYDMSWLSWQILSRLVRVESVTIANLVTGRAAIPEHLGPRCTPDALAGSLLRLIEDAGMRAAQRRAMAQTMEALGRGGRPPGLRAAQAVLEGLDRPGPN